MVDKMRDYEQELTSFMNGMAESVAEMSDEELTQELAEAPVDSEQIRKLLLNTIKECKQRPLLEAQKRYDENVAALVSDEFELPSGLEEQREMITSILASNPQIGTGLLTAQYRDFTELPDEDVESYLRQLMKLVETQTPVVGEKD
jgi:Glu-tRNA(Gln) amidotransferase subunit E-like FAD-binding protein